MESLGKGREKQRTLTSCRLLHDKSPDLKPGYGFPSQGLSHELAHCLRTNLSRRNLEYAGREYKKKTSQQDDLSLFTNCFHQLTNMDPRTMAKRDWACLTSFPTTALLVLSLRSISKARYRARGHGSLTQISSGDP